MVEKYASKQGREKHQRQALHPLNTRNAEWGTQQALLLGAEGNAR